MWGDGEARKTAWEARCALGCIQLFLPSRFSFFFFFLSFFLSFPPPQSFFFLFSPEALVPRMGVEIREKEGHGNKELQKKTCLPVACARIGRVPSPLR